MKRYASRCFFVGSTWRKLLLYCCLVISIIAVSVHFINPPTPSSSRHSKEDAKPKKSQSLKRDIYKKTSFPMVREFRLNHGISKFFNENARTVGFPVHLQGNFSIPNSTEKIIYLATPYFGQWNSKHFYSLHLGNSTFLRYSCAVHNCHATRDPADMHRADAFLFHVRDLEVFSVPHFRSPSQVWILYSMEPPWLEIRDMRRFNGVFNWTMSYRRKSDVLMSYGFVGERPSPVVKLSRLKERLTSLRTKRNKAVWFVSNCHTDSNREEYVDRLRKVYPVDVFGGCGMEACRPAETQRCYSKVAMRYKFYLAFENSICRDYVTEKLFNSLEYDIVPVVLGGADYSVLVPPRSVINAMEFGSPEDLGLYLWKLSKDHALYLSYFAWKNTYRSYLQPWMCDLCAKLHEDTSAQTRTDLDHWWNEGHSCLRWSNGSFKRVKEYTFPFYH